MRRQHKAEKRFVLVEHSRPHFLSSLIDRHKLHVSILSSAIPPIPDRQIFDFLSSDVPSSGEGVSRDFMRENELGKITTSPIRGRVRGSVRGRGWGHVVEHPLLEGEVGLIWKVTPHLISRRSVHQVTIFDSEYRKRGWGSITRRYFTFKDVGGTICTRLYPTK